MLQYSLSNNIFVLRNALHTTTPMQQERTASFLVYVRFFLLQRTYAFVMLSTKAQLGSCESLNPINLQFFSLSCAICESDVTIVGNLIHIRCQGGILLLSITVGKKKCFK